MYIVLMPFPLQKARSSLKQKMFQSIWQAMWLNCAKDSLQGSKLLDCAMPQKYQIKNYMQETSEKQECIKVGCVPPAHWPYLAF